MHNSSSNGASLLGSLLSLGKSPSGAAPQKLVASAQQRNDTSSFNDAFSGVRQEVARGQSPVGRPVDVRADQPQQTNQPSPAGQNGKTRAQRQDETNAASRSRNAAESAQENAAKTSAAENRTAAGKNADNTGADQKVSKLKTVDDQNETTAESSAVASVNSAADLAVEELLPGPARVEQEIIVAGEAAGQELSETQPSGVISAILDSGLSALDKTLETSSVSAVADAGALQDQAKNTGVTQSNVSPVLAALKSEAPAAAAVTPSLLVGVSSAEKTSLGSESLLSKAATAAVIDSGGELNGAMTGKQQEALGEGSSKESFARLLATDKAISREPAATQAAAAIETVARAAEALAPAGRGFVVQSTVAPMVGQPQWSQAVGDRVLWLAAQNITSAELRLDPPELGPMQVRVSVNQDQVQVTFTSPHAGVREALDQGAARLREMFNEQGLNLNVDVSDRQFSRRQNDEGSAGGRSHGGSDTSAEETVVAETTITKLRLIDHYA